MQLKIRDVLDAIPAMSQIANEKLPAKVAYRVGKLARKMNNVNRDFSKARDAAIVRLGEKVRLPGKPDKDGKPTEGPEVTRVKPENAEAFNQEVDALLDDTVALEGCAKIPLDDIASLAVAPAVLADLELFIEAPQEAQPA